MQATCRIFLWADASTLGISTLIANTECDAFTRSSKGKFVISGFNFSLVDWFKPYTQNWKARNWDCFSLSFDACGWSWESESLHKWSFLQFNPSLLALYIEWIVVCRLGAVNTKVLCTHSPSIFILQLALRLIKISGVSIPWEPRLVANMNSKVKLWLLILDLAFIKKRW